MSERKVSLFVLGAAKCGTTTLHDHLNQHESIMMAHPKEPLFFEAEYEKGNSYYLEKYFNNDDGTKILGEARHRNLYLPFVVDRIKGYVTDEVKFLVILRNPVDRAYSHWWNNFSWGDEKKSFKDAIMSNIERLKKGPFFNSEEDALIYKNTLNFNTGYSPYLSYVDSGFYAEQIQRYIDIFGRDKIKIMFLEDLKQNPEKEMRSVFEFIGVDSSAEINYSVKNEANSKLGKNLLKIIKQVPGVKYVPKTMRSSIYNWIRISFKAPNKKEEYLEPMREILLEIYKPHIIQLEKLTHRSLDAWRDA